MKDLNYLVFLVTRTEMRISHFPCHADDDKYPSQFNEEYAYLRR